MTRGNEGVFPAQGSAEDRLTKRELFAVMLVTGAWASAEGREITMAQAVEAADDLIRVLDDTECEAQREEALRRLPKKTPKVEPEKLSAVKFESDCDLFVEGSRSGISRDCVGTGCTECARWTGKT